MNRILHSIAGVGLVIFLGFMSSGRTQEAERVWTSKDGRAITATLQSIDVEKSTVSLAREDGATFQVPIASLSLDDQAHVKASLAKFSWTDIPAVAPDDSNLLLALRAIPVDDDVLVTTLKRERTDQFEIRREAPLGYRERHLCDYSGGIPIRMAIDNQGNLLFLTAKTSPTAIHLIDKNGSKTQIYSTPETEDCKINTPVIGSQCQLAAIPAGGFILRARWKEVFQRNGKPGYTSRLNYFAMQLRAGKLVFTPHFSEVNIPMTSRLQTMEAFAGDRLIALTNTRMLALFDTPRSSNNIPDRSVSSPSDATWAMKLRPLQVVSKSQVIAEALQDDLRIVFLVDFEAKSFSPLGPVATTENERNSQLNYLAVSPDGQHLVYYNVAEEAFKWVELGEVSRHSKERR